MSPNPTDKEKSVRFNENANTMQRRKTMNANPIQFERNKLAGELEKYEAATLKEYHEEFVDFLRLFDP